MKLHQLPEWVRKHKTKGTQIVKIRNNFYLYKIKSVWNPEKRRAVKKNEKYLGRITEEGLKKPKYERVFDEIKEVTVKEYGASRLINKIGADIKKDLKRIYPKNWESIFSFAVLRFFENSPIKNLGYHFAHSHLSELFPNAKLSPKSVSELLDALGSRRDKVVEFMNSQKFGSENLIVDLTHIFSSSENINLLSYGHNSEEAYHKQFNMLLLFSKDKNMPIFFRIIDGAIKDISSIKNLIEETQIKEATFVGDKGFFSEGNEVIFNAGKLNFILPLRRNSSLIDYSLIKNFERKKFDGYFFFDGRHIWYKEMKKDRKRIILFFDERLKTEEENSFLDRISKKQASMKGFYEKEHAFGTIAVIVSSKKSSCEKVYQFLKARINIESAFDAFKNVLEADKTYMQNTSKLHGWMFINFISLQMYYLIYGMLLKNELLNNFSPKDIMLHFSKVYKIKLSEKEIISEVPKTTRILMEKMKLDTNLLLNS